MDNLTGAKVRPERTAAKNSESPSAQRNLLHVVAIGASAGGLKAFRQLLEHLPTNTGFAFVLVQHLPAGHERRFASLLSKRTSMPVIAVAPGVRVESDHVYILPGNGNMTIKKKCCALLDAEKRATSPDRLFHAFTG